MKPDILTLCILATAILASGTRHVAGFLTSQQSGQQPGNVNVVGGDRNTDRDRERDLLQGNGVASAPQRLHLPIFGRHGPPPSDVQDIQNVQETQERAVYDPGDELLRAQELGLGVMGVASPLATDYADAVYSELQLASNKYEVLKKMEEDLRAEQELVDKSALLMKMLEDPSLETLPLVYVEEEDPEAVIASAAGAEDYADLENAVQDMVLGQSKPKRSRYYRRYPWKRHNKNRGNYEPELRYACTPSKEDIFKLLVNLHENRKGNHSKTVNFCNRKRPAKAVFTNIRFLG